jgi:hypothetical protein
MLIIQHVQGMWLSGRASALHLLDMLYAEGPGFDHLLLHDLLFTRF